MKQYELFDFDEPKGEEIIKVPFVSKRLSKVLNKSYVDKAINDFDKLIDNYSDLKNFIKKEILSKNYKGNKFIFNFKHNIVIFNFDERGFLVEIEVDDSKWIYDFNIKKFKRVVISKFSKVEDHFSIFKEVVKVYFEVKKEYVPEVRLSRYEEFLME